jgi:hypothetical protein
MDDITARRTATITQAEIEHRREIVRQADAQNRIEGIYRGPETEEIVEAFVRGEIEVTDMIGRFKALSRPG